jgi:hypothetical protein
MLYHRSYDFKVFRCQRNDPAMTIKLTILVFLLTLSWPLSATWAMAENSTSGWLLAGFRTGLSDDNGVDFVQYEVFAAHHLPWQGQGPGQWRWSTRLEGTAALLRGAGKSALVSSLGPALVLTSPGGRWVVDGGSSVAYLSHYRFGDKHLGGNLQFISHLGIDYLLQPQLGIGYRVQHMSNADLYEENPGVDLHLLQISCRFR